MKKPPNGRLKSWPRSRDLFDSTGMTESLRRSLYMVIWSVTVGMISTVVTTGAAWTGFLLEVIRADDFQLGIIAAIPVAANTSQLFISYLMEKKRNRKFLFLFFGILGRSLWIPIGLVPFFIPEVMGILRAWVVVLLVALIAGGNSFVNLGYNSLVGDLVPIRIRGRYFSARQRVSLIAGILAGFIVSWIMDTQGLLGYSIVLVLAGIFGVVDLAFFFFIDWPAMRVPKPEEKQESFFSMIKAVFQNSAFMRVVLFYTFWNFAVNVSAPFFNVHMLENLHMTYTQITLFNQITSNISTVLFVSRWGRLLDRYGNKPVLQTVALVCMLPPFLWIFVTPETSYMIIAINLIVGAFWPSIDIGQQNLSLSQSSEKNRSMYVAVFFATYNLLGIALGNTVGGLLVQSVYSHLDLLKLPFLGVTLNKYHYIFITSAVLRAVTVFFILPLLKEEGSKPLGMMMRDVAGKTKTGFQQKLLRRNPHNR